MEVNGNISRNNIKSLENTNNNNKLQKKNKM